MAKIALICDTHVGVRNDSPVFHAYFARCMEHFFSVLDAENIKHVIHLGDLYDRRKYLSFLTASVCRETFLRPLEQRNIETHIISGNHDHYYKNTSFINSLDEIVKGKYINVFTYNQAHTITIDGLDILLIPWVNQANEKETEHTLKETKAEIVMGHLEINGFEMFRGTVSDHGVDKAVYSKFDLVFSGHYHHKSSKGNIHYLGAFAEYTWTDYNDPRGFHIFDTETREFKFYRNPYSVFKHIIYDDVKDTKIMETINAMEYSQYKDCYVKIVCVNKSNPYALDMMLDKLYKESPADISIVEDVSTFAENGVDEINEAEDTQTILDKYIDNLTLNVPNERMKSYLKDIYQEALTVEHV